MLWFQVSVSSHQERPNQLPGELALCPDCHRDQWHVFRLAGQTDVYIQCDQCGRVELMVGQADNRLAAYSLEQPPLSGTAYARELIQRGWKP